MSAPPEPPKTPEQAKAKAATKLATPHNPGSAGASEHMASRAVSEIGPYHTHDLSKTQTCTIEDLLIHLLSKIQTSEPEKPGRQLLDELLGLVLPLANANDKKTSPDIFKMKEQLKRYCETSAEKDRYAPFAGAANYGLKALKSLKTSSTQRATAHTEGDGHDDTLWFQVNDPTLILPANTSNEADDDETRRKPDIITLFYRAIYKLHNHLGVCTPADIIDRYAQQRPETGTVTWDMVMSSWEFKKYKDKIVQPPEFSNGGYILRQNTKSSIPPRAVMQEVNEYIAARQKGEKPEPTSFSNHEGSGSTHAKTRGNTASAESSEPRRSARIQKTGEKRPAEDSPSRDSSSSKKKRTVPQSPTPPAALQVAMYAAESMYAQLGRAQVLNFVIIDSRLWIWYFDHEGPIQSSGFDILEDLPYFLALLFILQRFDNKAWGFIPELSTDEIRLGGRTSGVFDRTNGEVIKAHYGLSGRCPRVLKGTFQNRDAALKLVYAEVVRTSEVVIVDKATGLLQDLPDMLACLPELLDARDFDDFNTCHIRQALGIKVDGDKLPHRVPRAIIFLFYKALTTLTTDMEQFRAAFARLVCCHAILWLRGIEHGDISVANLMCTADGTNTPKLCDYDLSHLRGEVRPVGFTNTGTLKFMASELLTHDAMNGEVQKVYRHDAEAFSWVLMWILGRFRNGKQLEPTEGRLFDSWANQVSFPDVKAHRDTAFDSITKKKAVFPQPLSAAFNGDAVEFIVDLRRAHLRSVLVALEARMSVGDPALDEEIAKYSSPAFIKKVLDTTLVSNSEYSGLVKVAFEAYMANENVSD